MKKWLTKEQTDVLLSIGFPPVQHCIETWQDGKIERLVRYTLGDLLEFLPQGIHEENFSIAWLVIDGSAVSYQNDEHWEMYTYFKHNELIDNVYDCLVSLKTDKRI
jgi:hypothetical protein